MQRVEERGSAAGTDRRPAAAAPSGEREVLHVLREVAERGRAGAAQAAVVAGIRGSALPAVGVRRFERRDEARELVDHRVDLVWLPQQVADLAHGIKILGPEFGRRVAIAASAASGKQRVVDDVVAGVPVRPPAGVGVPRQDPQLALVVVGGQVVGLEVVDHVLVGARPVVVVADRLDHRVPAVPLVELDVRADVGGGAAAAEVLLDGVVIAAIGRREGRLVALLLRPVAGLVDELVEVALLESVRLHEAHVVGLEDEVEAVEITAPPIRRLGCAIDDPPVHPVRVDRRHADLVVEVHVDGLVEPVGERRLVVESLAGGQRAPLLRVLFAGLVARLEVVTVVEPEAHRSLAALVVAAVGSAQPVADVVIDDAVVDDGGIPVVEEPPLGALADLVAAIVGEALRVVLAARDDVVDRHRLQRGRRVAVVVRHAVVDEVGKIQGRVVGVRHAGGESEPVRDRDAVAHQRAVRLGWQRGGIDVVAGERIAARAVIGHHHQRPASLVGGVVRAVRSGGNVRYRVRQLRRHVGPGGDQLVFQVDRADALRVGHLGGDHDHVGGGRLLRRVVDLADVGWRVGRETGVLRAGCRIAGDVVGVGCLDLGVH